jgi:hypothetical protein
MSFKDILSRTPKTVQVAVEYAAPHWIVLIKNPGQKEWIALRDPQKKIRIPDEFGNEIRTRPAIQSFAHKADADAWVKAHLPESIAVEARKISEVKSFVQSLTDSRSSTLRTQQA